MVGHWGERLAQMEVQMESKKKKNPVMMEVEIYQYYVTFMYDY